VQTELLRTDDSFTEILEKYADTVLRLCFVYLRNKTDAEDVFQNVFLKLCKIKPVFNDDEHVKAWLITVASNECKNLLKSFWRKRVVCIDKAVAQVKKRDNREMVSYIMLLPLKYRNVLYLHYFEDYKVSELALILKANQSTVKTRLKRGRELLKNELVKGGYHYE
jgi:RNA polymerase sigma factor (sigma-70 family)